MVQVYILRGIIQEVLLMKNKNMKDFDSRIIYDVCIVGAGTAGMGAAYALCNTGLKVVIVEPFSDLGGTAINGWVETWIEGINPPYLQEIITKNFNAYKDPKDVRYIEYAQNLIVKSTLPEKYNKKGGYNMHFNSATLASIYRKDIESQLEFTILYNHSFEKIDKITNGEIERIIVCDNCEDSSRKIIQARFFIDSSGDGVLCRSACPVENQDYFIGEDPYNRFNEDLMPVPTTENLAGKYDPKTLNEPSLFYKVDKQAPDDHFFLDNIENVKIKNKKIIAPEYIKSDGYINSYFLNPMTGLGLTGFEILEKTAWAYKEAVKRHLEHWKFVKSELELWIKEGITPTHSGYRKEDYDCNYTGKYAPMLGIRESYRINCDQMLNQNDLTELITSSNLKRFIACGSHTIDFHVWKNVDWNKVQTFNKYKIVPSGIPYDCLIPKKLNNVLIACRAYGASHIALSARRVNKDMAQLGWAAGFAIKQCLEKSFKNVREVDVVQIQKETGFVENVLLLETLYTRS